MGVVRSLQTIWKAVSIATVTRLLLYRSLVLSILLYNSETWYLKEEDKRKLLVFEMSVLHRISGFSLRDIQHNERIKEGLGMDADVVQLVHQ